jgi:hypothetical protein
MANSPYDHGLEVQRNAPVTMRSSPQKEKTPNTFAVSADVSRLREPTFSTPALRVLYDDTKSEHHGIYTTPYSKKLSSKFKKIKQNTSFGIGNARGAVLGCSRSIKNR